MKFKKEPKPLRIEDIELFESIQNVILHITECARKDFLNGKITADNAIFRIDREIRHFLHNTRERKQEFDKIRKENMDRIMKSILSK